MPEVGLCKLPAVSSHCNGDSLFYFFVMTDVSRKAEDYPLLYYAMAINQVNKFVDIVLFLNIIGLSC